MNSSSRNDSALVRRLLGYLRPYRKSAITAVVLLLLHSLLGVVGPLLTKIAVDRSLRPTVLGQSWLDAWIPTDRAEALGALVAVYAIILALNYVLRASQIQIMNRTGQDVMFDIRNETFQRLQAKRVSYFDSNPVGRLVTRVTSDVDSLNELFTSGIAAIAGDVVTLAFIFAAMLYLSVKLTLILLTMGPIIFLVTWLFRSRVRANLRKVRGAVANINAFLQERLSGITVIQLFGDEQRSLEEFEIVKQDHLSAELGAARAHSIFFPAVELTGAVAVVLLFVGGGWLSDEGSLSLGVLVAFLQFGSRIFRPIQDLSEKFNVLQSALASSERIFSLLDEPVDEAPLSQAAAEPLGNADIEFEHIWFAYNDDDWVLEDVSFRVEPYEMMAVVGHTGAGKTTLISLLLRFYEPQRGRILVGGKDIREWRRDALRKRFGVVLQDPHLFSGTIEQNIRLGDDVTLDQAREAAGRVQLLNFIEALPQGFQTVIGERGSSLSTGQKQLLSFARALARNSPFLILDEATSSVDSSTELLIRDALTQLVDKHTSIVIAHRLSTIKRASRILVMHKGKLREIGTHAELIAHKGLYWKLYQLQYQSQERGRRLD
ncbi:MAG: ABC transporter ATP-binding protein [Acidobacteria bacterium]|nr:ABC transporter ATP-binding protein [Acidobacteriota bacterium]MDA1233731.1 ABC transporter ATP-binding protein [Acidobacteriota bacterium]